MVCSALAAILSMRFLRALISSAPSSARIIRGSLTGLSVSSSLSSKDTPTCEPSETALREALDDGTLLVPFGLRFLSSPLVPPPLWAGDEDALRSTAPLPDDDDDEP